MKNTYKTYRKPNDEPLHIKKHSNHLPSVLRQLPKSISKRISSNEEQVVFRDSRQGFEFPQLNSLLRWPFSWQGKKIKETQNMIYIFKITIIWNVSHMNMLIIIIYEHFEHWIMLIFFIAPVIYNWALSNLKNLNLKFPKNIILFSLIYNH